MTKSQVLNRIGDGSARTRRSLRSRASSTSAGEAYSLSGRIVSVARSTRTVSGPMMPIVEDADDRRQIASETARDLFDL